MSCSMLEAIRRSQSTTVTVLPSERIRQSSWFNSPVRMATTLTHWTTPAYWKINQRIINALLQSSNCVAGLHCHTLSSSFSSAFFAIHSASM